MKQSGGLHITSSLIYLQEISIRRLELLGEGSSRTELARIQLHKNNNDIVDA
jgi:hypothetical protein